MIDTIAEFAPNIRDIILHRQVLTPLDLEREFGLTEGNIFQGELTLEQLFFLRPAPGWAQYTTPIRNLWMCGSATHPGGGIMGAPGRNAALKNSQENDVVLRSSFYVRRSSFVVLSALKEWQLVLFATFQVQEKLCGYLAGIDPRALMPSRSSAP